MFGDGGELSYSTSESTFIYQGKRIGVLNETRFVIRFENEKPVFGADYLAYKRWVNYCHQVGRVKRRQIIETEESGKTDC